MDLFVDMTEIFEYEPWNGKNYFVYVRIKEATGDMAWTTPVLITQR